MNFFFIILGPKPCETLYIFLQRLTQILEDVQKVLSMNIDEDSEKTLGLVSQDFFTLRNIWNKIRQRPPSDTVAGKNFGTF